VNSLTEAVDVASQALRQLTPVTTLALYRYDTNADVLVCDSSTGDPNNHIPGLTIRLGERVSGWAAANQRTSINSDASLDLFHIAALFRPPLRSTIVVPIVEGDRLLAVISGYSALEHGFNEAHLYAFERVAGFIGERMRMPNHQNRSVIPFRVSKPS